MATLYETVGAMQAVMNLMEEYEATGDDETLRAAILAMFQDAKADLKDKVDGYAAVITNLQAQAKARKEESDRMANLARVDSNRAEYLRARLQDAFYALGCRNLETARFRVSIAKHGGKAPLLCPDDPASVPLEFRRFTPSIDKEAIRQVLEAGGSVDGCSIGERGESLRIR